MTSKSQTSSQTSNRERKQERFEEAIFEMIKQAVIALPADVVAALKKAHKKEKSERAKTQLAAILDNIALAKKKSTPLCQDTGIPLFFVEAGRSLSLDFSLDEALGNAVRRATRRIPLRPNTVHPFTRKNTGDNTGAHMPQVTYEIVEGDALKITFMPKGAGSENMSALAMLSPSDGFAGIEHFALETVANAGGKPCPPTIVGLGIGGSADGAMALAKKAHLRPLGKNNPDKKIAAMERRLLKKINALDIGPMGLGGETTSLAVHIEYASCHTASLPVAINLQCWAARRATVIFDRNMTPHVNSRGDKSA